MPKRTVLEQEPSSGNVFADLGLADAGEHLIKAALVVKINRIVRQRHLTQAAAAQLMGIDQPKVSAMLAGQFRGYSVERLMRFRVALVQSCGSWRTSSVRLLTRAVQCCQRLAPNRDRQGADLDFCNLVLGHDVEIVVKSRKSGAAELRVA